MKRTFFTIILALIFGFSFGQTRSIISSEYTPPPETITVKDTTFSQDSRLSYMITTILPAIQKFMMEELAKMKVEGSVTYEQETVELFRDLQNATYQFAQNFVIVNEVLVNTEQIIQEFSELNARIEALKNDEDIKYIEAVREFQTIKERQEQLARYYQQIEASQTTYFPWKQPLGAHDAYNTGDKVTFNGDTYESIIDANVWPPDVTGWRQVK